MGQLNLLRTEFEAQVLVTTPANDDVQAVNFTGYFDVGDLVDVLELDAFGNILSTIASGLSILSIDPNAGLTLSAVVNTTGLVGSPYISVQNIDDGWAAVDRLYRRKFSGSVGFIVTEPISGSTINSPIAGQTTLSVADTSFLRVGDTIDVIGNEGIVVTGATILAVNVNADDVNNPGTVVINMVANISGFTNPRLVSTSITIQDAVERNQARIDEIDRPVENQYLGVGDNNQTAWEVSTLFKAASSKVLLDGNRKRLGTAGTRAALTSGAGNAQMLFTSMILGTEGNKTKVAVVAGAGLTVAVTGSFSAGYNISVNNNAGAATAKDIANAINANATAKRIVQARWGGTGLGLAVAFALTFLAGGLNNGAGDYAELEQVFNNLIANTGYKWFSFHIRPSEPNRMNRPPKSNEEIVIDYREAMENVDR